MQRSKETLEAAAERLLKLKDLPALVTDLELAATILSEHAAGMDAFDAWYAKFGEKLLNKVDARTIFFAGRASVSADLDALTDEAERCWRLAARIERVRDMLAAPKEGK